MHQMDEQELAAIAAIEKVLNETASVLEEVEVKIVHLGKIEWDDDAAKYKFKEAVI